MSQLILRRPSAYRRSDEWRDDDYDVIFDTAVVGRIMRVAAAPEVTPWMWTLAHGYHEDCIPTHEADARGRDGRVRQELAKGVRPGKKKAPPKRG
jgi:hypothetical protein